MQAALVGVEPYFDALRQVQRSECLALPCLDHICTPRLSRKAALAGVKCCCDALKLSLLRKGHKFERPKGHLELQNRADTGSGTCDHRQAGNQPQPSHLLPAHRRTCNPAGCRAPFPRGEAAPCRCCSLPCKPPCWLRLLLVLMAWRCCLHGSRHAHAGRCMRVMAGSGGLNI